MNSSKKGSTFLGKGGLVALVALAVALCAQVAGAEAAVTGPGGRVLTPNTIQHAVQAPPRKAGPIAPSGRRLTVTTTADGGTGSLRQLIAEAQPGDTVVVPPGTYVLTEGELKIDKALTIAGSGAAQTTIDGAGNTRGFKISGVALNTPVTISGLTITHTKGNMAPEIFSFSGAAVLSFNADLTLSNDVITRNSVKAPAEELVFGGAVEANGGRFTMIGTTVSENSAVVAPTVGEFGGFIIGAGVSAEGVETAIVEDSNIVANRALALGRGSSLIVGGGMRIVAFGPTQVSGSTITGNVAEIEAGNIIGGGIHIIGERADMTNDRLVSNLADAGSGIVEGGGLSFSGIGGIFGSVLESNRALGAGSIGGNLAAEPGFFLSEHDLRISHTSVLHGVGPAGSENCATTQGATIRSLGFNRESTDQCGFHAEGDEVNVG
jgi:hypothetical protein